MNSQLESPIPGRSGRARRGFAPAAGLAGAILATLLALLPAAALSGGPGREVASDWVRTKESGVRLISGVTGVGDLTAVPIGLQVALEPGWKTYWRSPGDAGIPVAVDWARSENVAAAEMAWPVPHRFTLFGLDTFGYEREVVFPITVRPEEPGRSARLRAQVDYLVCEQICIPQQATLALDLPAGPAEPTAYLQLIDRFADRVPGDGSAHGLRLERVGIEQAGGGAGPVLEAVAVSRLPFTAPDLIVEGPPDYIFAAPEVRLSEGGTRATLRVPVSLTDGARPLAGTPLTLTLVDGTRGLEAAVTPGPVAGPSEGAAGRTAAGLLPTLLVALLGGAVLNLMPCVLPVLSLKLLGLVGHGGGAAGAVRVAFLASAAGVLAAFLTLAAALAALKTAGVAVGWGIQFQQPLFLTAMVLVLTLFACNLWGWFEIPLPGWLGRLAGPSGMHADGRRRGSLGGHFAAGAFATLLATPCSAPFVGTAVGFALARGPVEIFAIFAALGLGLAMPYLLVAAVPSLATRLPRPGRWMITLRQLLGFALAATAAWLLSVLVAQIGLPAASLIGGLMLAVVAALWARRRLPAALRLAAPATVILLALAAFLVPAGIAERPAGAKADIAEGPWEPFVAARIDGLVAQGKSVFVDVTADWCITCQVNKRLVLAADPVAERLASENVIAMRADWTRPSDTIAAYLASFGRYGIPFNVVYGPGAPDGLPLPELLTEEAVLEAMARAAGG